MWHNPSNTHSVQDAVGDGERMPQSTATPRSWLCGLRVMLNNRILQQRGQQRVKLRGYNSVLFNMENRPY